ncbi:MAG: copper ion binding protein [Anaerovoracaceae bacterium]
MKTILKVEGMSCSHCEAAVKNAVSEINGVKEVIVNLAEKTVSVDHNETAQKAEIIDAIEEQGYDVV